MIFFLLKRLFCAASGPFFSEPAIGCEPIKFLDSAPNIFFTELIIFVLVLPTSVINVDFDRKGFICFKTNSICLTGVAMITRSASWILLKSSEIS